MRIPQVPRAVRLLLHRGLDRDTQAAAGDFKQATTLTGRFTAAAQNLHHSVVRDALAAGLDWWQIGELLTVHPQAAFDAYDDLDDDAAIRRWTTAALYPDELGWLRETLALNAEEPDDDEDEDDDLQPLP